MKALQACAVLLGGVCASCTPWQGLKEALDPDLLPPTLLAVRAPAPDTVELLFDEPALCRQQSVRIEPPLAVLAVTAQEELLALRVAEQAPGTRYLLEACVEDAGGNALSFVAEFYGFNPRPPGLLINEFSTRGTGNHPDVVELKVTAGGNMGGVVLYQGTPSTFDDRLVFPAFEVGAGDFILAHFKPQGLPEELDETAERTASGGLDASEQAFDFWVPGGAGLSGNNGVLSLYGSPGGPIIDGVLYSNRSSDSDELYGGFGTKSCWERAQELARDGGWRVSGDQVRPEDAVSPEGSTGTRTLCRGSTSADTDGPEDWHIVPTLGFSFGGENSDQTYP